MIPEPRPQQYPGAALTPDPALLSELERFARDEGGDVLPWASRLAPRELGWLRDELSLLLAEPELTGEPLDWRELHNLLHEFAVDAGWQGELLAEPDPIPEGDPAYAVELHPDDREALAGASAAVRQATREILARFLPHHPTSAARLERGHLKKMGNRDIWQIDLPDGYRLRYFVAEPERTVYVVYLGPHPDGYADGREQAIIAAIQRRRHGG